MIWLQVGLAAAGAISSIAGGLGAQDAAESAAKRQAMMIDLTEKENRRRRENELKRILGQTNAAIYASNLVMGGSAKNYRDSMETEYRREMAWDQAKARIEKRAALKGGEMAGKSALYSGIGSALGFAGQAASAWGG